MHHLSCLLIIALGLLATGCHSPSPAANVTPSADTTEPPAVPARPASAAAVTLVDVRFGDRADAHSPVVLMGRPVYTGPGEIVGIAGRIESYTLTDGTRKQVSGPWRLLDTDELGYGSGSPVVSGCMLLHDRPWPAFDQVTLRIRAAVADRVERIEIPDFEPGVQQSASAHGYTLTIKSELGKALGRYEATLLYPMLHAENDPGDADAGSVWTLTPADRAKADEASLRINWRFGFVGDDGRLITPSGQSGGYQFLGRHYAGRTFRASVPVGVRLVDSVVDIEIP